MPELPEVETVRRGLNQLTLNQEITGGDVLLERTIAYPFSVGEFVDGIKGNTIATWHRRGKYLLAELSPLFLTSSHRLLARSSPANDWSTTLATSR